MKRKFLAFLLAFVMIVGMLPMAALAADAAAGDTTPAGTEADPIKLGSSDVTGGLQISKGGYYKLTEAVSMPYILGTTGAKAKVTLDLAGFDITQTGEYSFAYIDDDMPELTIVNTGDKAATIKPCNNQVSFALSGASPKLTLGENITVDSSNVENRDVFAILVTEEATGVPEVNLNGCTINGANGVTVNGNCPGTPKIMLNGATIIATHNETNTEPVGIYQSGQAETNDVNISNSTIDASCTNGTGIEVRAGKLTLNNTVVKGGSGNYSTHPNGNGSTTLNTAVALAQHTTQHSITVKLEGNVNLTANTALSIANPQKNNNEKTVTADIAGGNYTGKITVEETGDAAVTKATKLTITGGTFNTDVSKYVPEGTYQCKQTGEKWVVSPYVAPNNVTFSLATGVILSDVTNATAVTGTPEKYAITDAAKAVTFKLTAPENAAIDTVKLGETALTAAEGVYTIPANQKADVTVTVTTKTTVVDAAKLTIAVPSTDKGSEEKSEAELIKEALGKEVSALQSDIKINGLTITGTLNYVKEFTKFNVTDKTEQQGNYIALKLTSDKAETSIRVKSNNGDAQGYKTLDPDGLLVHRISVNTDTGRINPIHVKLGEAEYDIDLTGLKLGLPPMPAPEAPSEGSTEVKNDLSSNTQVAKDIQNAIANVSTGKVDANANDDETGTGTAPEVKKNEVTITFSGKVENNDEIKTGSVKLSAEAVKTLKNDTNTNKDAVSTVTVNATVETNVADVVLPAGALEKLDATKDIEVKVDSKEKTAYDSTFTSDEDLKKLVNAAEVIADVTVKQDTASTNAEPFKEENLTGAAAITLRFKVEENKAYQAIYIDTEKATVTKVGAAKMPTGNDVDGYYFEIKVSHLSPYALVDEAANRDALAKLDGTVEPGAVKAVYVAATDPSFTAGDKTMYYGGKLTISGLDKNKTYLVRLDNGLAKGDVKPAACYVLNTSNIGADGTATLSCQPSMNIMIFEIASGKTVNDVPTAGNESAVWPNIYYRVGDTNNGTPVSSLKG